jgi:serine/threonine protein kinase
MARIDKSRRSNDTLHDGGDDEQGISPSATFSALENVDVDAATSEVDPFGDLSEGSQIGRRYVIDRRIGKGAAGVVFEASHLVIGKKVALKCLYPQHRATRTSVERFFREARIAATVEHPNVIEVFDGGDEDGVLFLAMELLEGETLGERIDRGAVGVSEAIEIFLGIMDGVAAVHERGVIHRDLKPDNIFLVKPRPGRLGGAKVLDFGISKLMEPGLRELTSLGTVMGTPFYMAPEQVANTRDVDARADVYSLGVMLYEALAGDLPYPEESVIEIFKRAQEGNAAPLSNVRPEVPRSLSRLVEKAMKPAREDRFASVAEMRDALAKVLLADTDPSTMRPSGPEERATVRDIPSPLLGMKLEESATAPRARSAPPARPLRERSENRNTVHLSRVVAETPRWVWIALAGAAGMTLLSLVTAVIALIW